MNKEELMAMESTSIECWPNGKTKRIIGHRNGLLHGLFIEWDEDGKCIRYELYKKGVLINKVKIDNQVEEWAQDKFTVSTLEISSEFTVHKFCDCRGEMCSLMDSPEGEEPFVWVGVDNAICLKNGCGKRMLLNRLQARWLGYQLIYFYREGRLFKKKE